MTKGEAVNWLINISADIGKAEHRELWHYEQALYEIREMLESAQPQDIARDIANIIENEKDMRVISKNAQPEIIRCKDCVYVSPNTKNGCELIRWRWFDGSEFMGGDDYCSRAERRE